MKPGKFWFRCPDPLRTRAEPTGGQTEHRTVHQHAAKVRDWEVGMH